MFKRKMSKAEIEAIIKSNPELVKVQIASEHSKTGYFELMIPKAIIESGIDVSFKIPKEYLVDEKKTGKLGSYQIKQSVNLKKLRFPKYTNITLYVDDLKK